MRRDYTHKYSYFPAIPKPVIAVVRGATVGVGWSLALACDLILASDNAKFSLVFKKIGLAPDGAAAYFLTQYIGVLRARELMMTARMVPAAEAHQLGMVNGTLDLVDRNGNVVAPSNSATNPIVAYVAVNPNAEYIRAQLGALGLGW